MLQMLLRKSGEILLDLPEVRVPARGGKIIPTRSIILPARLAEKERIGKILQVPQAVRAPAVTKSKILLKTGTIQNPISGLSRFFHFLPYIYSLPLNICLPLCVL